MVCGAVAGDHIFDRQRLGVPVGEEKVRRGFAEVVRVLRVCSLVARGDIARASFASAVVVTLALAGQGIFAGDTGFEKDDGGCGGADVGQPNRTGRHIVGAEQGVHRDGEKRRTRVGRILRSRHKERIGFLKEVARLIEIAERPGAGELGHGIIPSLGFRVAPAAEVGPRVARLGQLTIVGRCVVHEPSAELLHVVHAMSHLSRSHEGA